MLRIQKFIFYALIVFLPWLIIYQLLQYVSGFFMDDTGTYIKLTLVVWIMQLTLAVGLVGVLDWHIFDWVLG